MAKLGTVTIIYRDGSTDTLPGVKDRDAKELEEEIASNAGFYNYTLRGAGGARMSVTKRFVRSVRFTPDPTSVQCSICGAPKSPGKPCAHCRR